MGIGEKSMRKVVIGTDDLMRVVVVPDASMNVDYMKDIETAKANFKNMVEKLGIEYIEPIEVQIDPNDIPEIIPVENERKVLRKYPAKSKDYFIIKIASKRVRGFQTG